MKVLKLFLFVLLLSSANSANAAIRLSQDDYQKLVDLGYNKLDAYSDDYTGVQTYWYTLEEHLSLKPKFLALLSQEMQIDGKVQLNYHVYNSRHHVFADREAKCGNDSSKLFNVLKKCEELKMPMIDDEGITLDNFAKTILDHCSETKVKNLRTQSGKQINISGEQKCNIKFINFKRYEFAKILKEVGSDTPSPIITQPKANKNNLDIYKKQCEELGFTPKTEKFGECVLRLAESSQKK